MKKKVVVAHCNSCMKPIFAGEHTAENIYGEPIHFDCPRFLDLREIQQQQAAD